MNSPVIDDTDSSHNAVPVQLAASFIEFAKKTEFRFKAKHNADVTIEMCEHVLGHAAHEIRQLKFELAEATKPHCSETELETKYRNLVTEFRLSLSSAEDIRILKAKLLEIVTRSRQTREACLIAQDEARKCKKMTDMVVCHLEKLVNHIKREAQVKAKQDDQFRTTTDTLRQLKQNYTFLLSKLASKNKYINELQNGSRLLEDQLKLMDEKYLQLRFKLDYAREHGIRSQRKADAKLATVMEKFTEVAAKNGININTIDFSGCSTVGGSLLDGDNSSIVSGLTKITAAGGLPATPIKRSQTAPGGRRPTDQTLGKTDKTVFEELRGRQKELKAKGIARRALSSLFPEDSVKPEPTPYQLQMQALSPLLKAPSVEEKRADAETAAVLNKIRKRQAAIQINKREWTSGDLRDLADGK